VINVRHRAAVVLALAAAGSAVLTACSSSGGSQPSGSTDGSAVATTPAAAGHAAAVTITAADGCELNSTEFAAGGITFTITNKDATAVSEVELLDGERIIGEKENVPPGLGGKFAVSVDAGRYTVYCPGAATEKSTITVTGKAAPADDSIAALIKQGTSEYKKYVDTQVAYLVQFTGKLTTALQGNDVKSAQVAYIAARPYYEKIEPVAESFVLGKQNLDAEIDARAGDVPASKWSGFHRIEQLLFQKHTIKGTQQWGTLLLKDVKLLQQKTAELTYQAPDLANGAQELLDEVAASKITGEEERYSHIDLVDMVNNVEGAEQAFADLQPAVTKIDPDLAKQITTQFASLDKTLDNYRTRSNPSGYRLYTSLDDTDRHALAAAVKAVQEPLSNVAGKVANP
jgi:iron uptake system component EfeO